MPCNRWRGSATRKVSTAPPEVTLSAGGSAVFDVVARSLPTQLSRPVRTILRSGCYVTHDSGFYERFLHQVLARSGAAWRQREGLQPALEIWTRGAVATRARARDPGVRQARRVVRYRLADAVRARARRRAHAARRDAGASTSSTTSTRTCGFRPVPTCASATSSVAASRIPARRSTNGAGCRSSTMTTASRAPSGRSSDTAWIAERRESCCRQEAADRRQIA